MPKWLKILTLFLYYPGALVLTILLITGSIFRHEVVVILLMVIMFCVAAIHTGRAFWDLGRTR
jgi:hypothetical protein